MTFVELPVVPIYWHFPRTIKGYTSINVIIFYISLFLFVVVCLAYTPMKMQQSTTSFPTKTQITF